MTGTEYPPEPWDLRGQLHASVFFVPAAKIPLDLPAGYRPVRIGGRAIVGTAWVEYEPGGVLDYREVMAVVLVRSGLRVLPSIVRIWVDSPASRDGGRALWGIPKGLATFSFGGGAFDARTDDGPIARGTVRTRLRLPGRLPLGFSLAQRSLRIADRGATKISPIRSRAALELGSATFDADAGGPLGFLAGHRPWLTVTLRDFVMSFGHGAAQVAEVSHN